MYIRLVRFSVLFVFLTQSVQGAIVWNELDVVQFGILSRDNLAPTDLGVLRLGTSTIQGIVEESAGSVGDFDVMTFEIPTGAKLESIVCTQYLFGDGRAFLGIDDTTTFPFNPSELDQLPDETQFIGGVTFGRAFSNVGVDLLSSSWIGGRFIGRQPLQGFPIIPPAINPPTYEELGAGTYTIYVQQTGPLTQYALDLNVSAIPEPSSTMLILSACSCFIATRRRRNRIGYQPT